MGSERWTEREEEILKEKYPDQGSDIPELKEKRSKEAIRKKANLMGLRYETKKATDEEILKALEKHDDLTNEEIAKKLGYSSVSHFSTRLNQINEYAKSKETVKLTKGMESNTRFISITRPLIEEVGEDPSKELFCKREVEGNKIVLRIREEGETKGESWVKMSKVGTGKGGKRANTRIIPLPSKMMEEIGINPDRELEAHREVKGKKIILDIDYSTKG